MITVAFFAAAQARAYNEPAMNLGLTDIADVVPSPGVYFKEYIQTYSSSYFNDRNGARYTGNPNVSYTLSLSQLTWLTEQKVLGGNLGFLAIQPRITLNGSGTLGAGGPDVTANQGVYGDLLVGAMIQWYDNKLLGKPFMQRAELDVTLPTGQYDPNDVLNPGANIYTFEPYYAFCWKFAPQFSTSWRFYYTYNTANTDAMTDSGIGKIQPGQAFHFNYEGDYEVYKNVRVMASGYYLKQLTDDKINGAATDGTKEEVLGYGPGIAYNSPGGMSFALKSQYETDVKNRPQGVGVLLRTTYKF
jgi:anthranilate 1,2-dioxygenase (deaminating, decarboxylating) large subunit